MDRLPYWFMVVHVGSEGTWTNKDDRLFDGLNRPYSQV